MHNIEMQTASEEFARCWHEAGRHIQRQVQGPLHSWLKANLDPPFLEHLSFRLGNQLFFIRIEDVDGTLEVPGTRRGLHLVATGCKGHACLMPMRRQGATWEPVRSDWGLLDAQTGEPINPVELVSDERIEMTDWEVQDFAVQIVRDWLVKQGRKLMSWQGNPSVDPSIWFVGDEGPEWVVVRAARYPRKTAEPPSNWGAIAAGCARIGRTGHFASVSFANADEGVAPDGSPARLWRGHGMHVNFEGIVPGPSR